MNQIEEKTIQKKVTRKLETQYVNLNTDSEDRGPLLTVSWSDWWLSRLEH